MPRIWAGIDVGKTHHHCVVIDADGTRLLSRKVANDESSLLDLVGDVLDINGDVLWAVDVNGGAAVLLVGLLLGHDQPIAYLTGLSIHLASAGYRGEGKTDARDAFVIADQARMRRDVPLLRPGDDIAVDLRILTGRRVDLVQDRTRAINRLRAGLLEIFPGLERVLDLTRRGPVVLLTKYQTPAAFRRAGAKRIEAWLRGRKVRGAEALAAAAVEAAKAQHTVLPGQDLAAAVIARQAEGVIALDNEIADTESLIQGRFRQHRHAEVIVSLPGMGPKLGAEFIAATGGDMTAYTTSDRLAAFAGLAPAPRDSGRISGNLKRPRRYNRALLRACYLPAMPAIQPCPVSRGFYHHKPAQDKAHKQTILAPARPRLNIL